MDAFEVITVINQGISGAVSAIALYLTVISGFLVAAFMVGEKLNKYQMILVTSLFVVFSLFFTIGTYIQLVGNNNIVLIYGAEFGFEFFPNSYIWAITTAEILGIIGSIYYMYDIRKNSDK